MIARLKGTVDMVGDTTLILDVNGVGYLVHCATPVLQTLRVGMTVSLDIVMVVREDSMTLFGFATPLDKQWFEILTSVQGVGAKVGLAIQSVLSSQALYTAVGASDSTAFAMANGVGPKLAGRIALELKDKVAKTRFVHSENSANIASGGGDSSDADTDNADDNKAGKIKSDKTTTQKPAKGKKKAPAPLKSIPMQIQDDALSAMVNLGYSRSQAYTAVSTAVQELPVTSEVGDIVTMALKNI